MTRSSFSVKSTSAFKKQNTKNCKQQLTTAMFRAEQNVRPRKNTSWVLPNHSPKEEVATIEKKYNNYETEYGSDYLPVKRTPKKEFKLHDKNPKEKHKMAAEEAKKYVQEYCEGTSLHGLKYVGTTNISLFERIFWLFAFFGAMAFAAYFISNIYDRWSNNPLIVGINPQYQTIYNIPFPALTICNMNQVKKEQAEEVFRGNNMNEKWLLEDICDQDDDNITLSSTNESSTDWHFIKTFILKVNQPCSELLAQCMWQGNPIDCAEIMNSALTDEGVCCTFNRVHNKYMYHNPTNVADFNISFPVNNIDWTPEAGYPPNANNTTWPFRGQGPGEHLGLTLIINIASHDYYCSSTNSVGIKLRLHSPVETPMMADYGFFLQPRKEFRVSVRPNMDEASSSIYKIPIKQRQCYFSVEKKLYYYRTYTKMNCELECLSNYTLKKCNCIPFYLPKSVDSGICDKRKEDCYEEAKTDMHVILHPERYCDCLPACNEISYAQDNSFGDIAIPSLKKGKAHDIETTSLIILHVFYQSTQFRSYQKSEIFGFTEFLSNSGGLLGLFLGFSFLSMVELIYHLTLRLWCVYYTKMKEREKTVVVYPFAR